MPRSARVLWYRCGLVRWCGAAIAAGAGVTLPLVIMITALAGLGFKGTAVIGVLMLAVGVFCICLILRAGIGVTPDHVLVRNGYGQTTAVPWADIERFEVSQSGLGNGTGLFVVVPGGQRWTTVGCTSGEWAAEEGGQRIWRLLRALERHRLVRVPGAVSDLPAPPPDVASPPPRWFIGICAAVVAVVWAATVYAAASGIGAEVRAASGAGTVGYFVAPTVYPRGGSPGEFLLPDGTVTRRNVTLHDSGDVPTGLRAGVRVPARDTGASGTVFLRDDPGAWTGTVDTLLWLSTPFALIVIPLIGQLFCRDDHANL